MFDARTLSRPLLAATFISGGYRALRDPERLALAADRVGSPIVERLGAKVEPTTLVRINGGVQLGAGVLLALGRLPRVASLALAGSLVPTTLAGHRFWEQDDPAQRHAETQQFLKNAGLLGGLLLGALDTGGRPSVFWRGKRAASKVAGAVGHGSDGVGTTAHDLARTAGTTAQDLAHRAAPTAQVVAASVVSNARHLRRELRHQARTHGLDDMATAAGGLASRALDRAGDVASEVAARIAVAADHLAHAAGEAAGDVASSVPSAKDLRIAR